MIQLTLLQAAAPASGGGMGSLFFMLIILIGFMYFFMIRPQNKRQKELKQFRASLQPGDEVITNGGIYGHVKEVTDDYYMIEIANGVKIKVGAEYIFPTVDSTKRDNKKSGDSEKKDAEKK